MLWVRNTSSLLSSNVVRPLPRRVPLAHQFTHHFLTQITLIGLFTSPGFTATFTAYGPETFQRGTGAPVTVEKSFTAPNPNTSYILKIYNGGLVDGGFEKASSSVISLNGLQIVGPNEFNQNVRIIEKAVTLSADNTLSVEVRGKPGGAIVIEIAGVDNDPPTITASVNPSPNAAGWNNTNVTVSFACADMTSGIAVCPAPVTLTTEGANQPVNGTATDLAGNSATVHAAVNIDKTLPVIKITSPQPDATLNQSKPGILVEFMDGLSGIDTSTVNLFLDGLDVSSDALITASGLTYTPTMALRDGAHSILVSASDRANNTGRATSTFTTKTRVRPFIFPEPGFDAGSYKDGSSIYNGPIKIGDINRDGILDVVVLNHVGGVSISKISVIFGKGDGSFESPITLGELDNGYYDDIAVDDFNGDGSPDLSLTVFLPNRQYQLLLFMGNGDGTFTTGSSYTIGVPGRILTGTFDADLYEDIAIAGQNGNVSLFHGNGDGSFGSPPTIWSGVPNSRITDAVSADFNHDGLTDTGLIVGDTSGGREFLVLLNNNDGAFQTFTVHPWDNNLFISSLTIGDLNGDGYADIVLLIDGQFYLQPDLMVFLNNGSGNFPVSHLYRPGLVIPSYNFSIFGGRMVRLSDLNGDQRLDLLISYRGTVFTFLGNGDGTFQPPSELSVSGGSLNIGDFDQDGAQDLVTVGEHHIFILFGHGDGGFNDREEIPTNRGVYDLTSADLDGDRTPDLVLPGDGFGALFSTILNRGNTWIENNVGPPFQTAGTYRVGIGPVFVKTGDLNKDGHPDPVTANELSGDISVLLNSGDGNLNASVSYPVGSVPVFIALENLNKDGYLDIVTANSGSNDVSILLGRGDGSFQSRKIFAAGPNPKSLAIADINGDGHPDIVVADYDPSVNYVSILLGNGDGTFLPYSRWTTGGWSPVSIRTGDFNRDGLADFVVLNHTRYSWGGIHSSLITLLLGRGDGTFNERIAYNPGDAYFYDDILSEDFNRDGKPDLITFDYNADTAWVFINDGYGRFNEIKTLSGLSALSLTQGSSAALGDLNHDGDIDLLVGGGSSLLVWLGKGDGTFLRAPSIGGSTGVSSMEIGDMNGDGVTDIALVDDNNLSLIPGEGEGIFAGESVIHQETSDSWPLGLVSADLNGDHNQDVVLSNIEKVGIYAGYTKAVVYWGAGDNTFRRGPTLQTSTPINRGVFAADLNQDGRVDIALAQDIVAQKAAVLVYINNGDETFRESIPYTINEMLSGIRIADINHDGRLDIVSLDATRTVLGDYLYSLSIHTGNGDGTFQHYGAIPLERFNPSDVIVQDFNRDGFGDLAVSMLFGNTLRIYLNNGNGTFNGPITYEIGVWQGTLITQDFNQDGFIDLVVRDDAAQAIYLLPGNGDGTFQPSTAYGLGEIGGGGGMASRDFNLDGRMDIAASPGHFSINHVKLLINLLPPLRTPPSPPANLSGMSGDMTVSLTWTASPENNIAGYNLYRSLSSGGGYVRIKAAPITSLLYTDSSVTNGQTYYYTVSAVDVQGDESSLSRKVKAAPHPADITPPAVNITTPADGEISVNPLLFVSGTIDDVSAVVTVNGRSAAVQTQSGTFTAYNIPLDAGMNIITVTAVDSAGNRSSDTVTVTYSLVAVMIGTVQDAITGAPIGGATVSIQDSDGTQSLTTASNGLYAFTRVVPGNVTITVTTFSNDYQPLTFVQTLSPGQAMTLNIPLDLRPAILTGTVYDSFPVIDNPKPFLRVYRPIEGVIVSVTDRTKTQSVVTDVNGAYRIENIAPYEITVTVTKADYETNIQYPWVYPRLTQLYNFYLYKLPPSVPTGLTAAPVIRGVELKWNANTESDLLGYNVYRATTSGGDYSLLNMTPVTSLSFRDSGLTGGTTYYYAVTAINTSRSESGFSAEASATTPSPTVPITITFPSDGTIINASDVIVTGTVDAAFTEIGVVIEVSGPNGIESVPAQVNRNSFAALVPLQQGVNTITAVAVDPGGAYGEASITVNASIPQEEVRLTANPESGVPDIATGALAVKLQVLTTLSNPATQYQWDYEGNGTIDQTGAALTEITVQYQAVGIYYPTVVVTDANGNAYTATTVVNVLSREELDALLKQKWGGMRDALRQGNIDQAVAYFTFGSQDKYRRIFGALGDQLADEATNLPNIALVTFYGTTGKYRVQRNVTITGQSQVLTYWVYFIQDTDGIWRIKQF